MGIHWRGEGGHREWQKEQGRRRSEQKAGSATSTSTTRASDKNVTTQYVWSMSRTLFDVVERCTPYAAQWQREEEITFGQ